MAQRFDPDKLESAEEPALTGKQIATVANRLVRRLYASRFEGMTQAEIGVPFVAIQRRAREFLEAGIPEDELWEALDRTHAFSVKSIMIQIEQNRAAKEGVGTPFGPLGHPQPVNRTVGKTPMDRAQQAQLARSPMRTSCPTHGGIKGLDCSCSDGV